MRLHRFLFVATLYLMAAASFVVFATNLLPWLQFRYFSSPATIHVVRVPVSDAPGSELKAFGEERKRGTPIRLVLPDGKTLESRAHLGNDKFSRANSERGLPVLYRPDGADKVRVIGGLHELESPWLWLALFAVFSVVAPLARKLLARENVRDA